jgi:hypothetical protein
VVPSTADPAVTSPPTTPSIIYSPIPTATAPKTRPLSFWGPFTPTSGLQCGFYGECLKEVFEGDQITDFYISNSLHLERRRVEIGEIGEKVKKREEEEVKMRKRRRGREEQIREQEEEEEGVNDS